MLAEAESEVPAEEESADAETIRSRRRNTPHASTDAWNNIREACASRWASGPC